MKINSKWLLLALVLMLSAAFLVPSLHATGIDGGYVGTDVCLGCHDGSPASDKSSFVKTGHPWKYKDTNGAIPADPISGLFPRPLISTIQTSSLNDLIIDDGTGRLDWSAINFTIGGYGWKIRWGVRDFNQDVDGVNETGYVWAGTNAQYNTENGSWSGYPGTLPSNKKYECAICHNTNGIVSTTGYSCWTDGGTDAAPARTEPWAKNPGMGPVTKGGYYSSWSLDGVQCEACHGKGSNASNNGHADVGASAAQSVLTLSGGVEICAKCHIRAENTSGASAECGGDANPAILTNGAKITDPFINHHEQYNELVGYNGDGAHASLKCTTCHNPHKRAAGVISTVATALGITGDNTKPEVGAIKKQCTECHYGKDNDGAANIAGHSTLSCADCHMAEATKTATQSSTSGWGRKADLKTHIFRIDPTGSSIVRSNGFTNIAQNYITPKYACGKCHDSNIYGSAIAGPTSEAEAQAAATNYHAAVANIDGGYVGSSVCGTCHTSIKSDFDKTGHPYKLRFTNGATPSAGDPLSALLTSSGNNTIASVAALNADASVPTSEIDADGDGKLDWSAVDYVIGGFGWKARWGIKDTSGDDKTGYVWSAASLVGGYGAQFNMLAADTTLDPGGKRADWSTYGSATGQSKKYQCAVCHNTNGKITNYDPDHLDCRDSADPSRTEPWASTGLTSASHGGFYSEWTFSGVQCEACHGAGLAHATAASTSNIIKNTSKDACGKCHIRATNTAVTLGGKNDECGGDSNAGYLNNGAPSTAGDFNGHHEQYNEMVGVSGDGAHASLNCVDCHNPHKRSHKVTSAIASGLGITDNNQSAEARGAVVSCSTCHAGKTLASHPEVVSCVDCHMGEITKSATGVKGTWGKMGDVKGHVFKIDPTQTANTRTNGDGKVVATNYITVDYACGKCHDSNATMSNTYVGVALTQAQAMAAAVNMHSSTAPFPSTHNNPVAAFTITDNTPAPGDTDKTGTTSTTFTLNTTGSSADTINGTAPTAYVNWGDGSAMVSGAVGSSFTKTYSTNGTFKVTLVVKDALGYNATVSDTITVSNQTNGAAIGTYTVTAYTDPGASTPMANVNVYLKQVVGANTLTKASGKTDAAGSLVLPTAAGTLNTGSYKMYVYAPSGKTCYTDSGYATKWVNGDPVTVTGVKTLYCK